MEKTIRIELHCHSNFSDGFYPPDMVAQKLSESSVSYAALTDHDTLDGQMLFSQVLNQYGIGYVSGVELTTYTGNKEIHILSYGFDINNKELKKLITKIRPSKNIAGSNFVDSERITTTDAINTIHNAGGVAILAHPFFTEPDIQKLTLLIKHLQSAGLDGIEMFRPEPQSIYHERILKLSEEYGFIFSAGTDVHFSKADQDKKAGIEIPTYIWKDFRNGILKSTSNASKNSSNYDTPLNISEQTKGHQQSHLKSIIFPVVITLLLFAMAIFFVILPYFEQSLLDRKRETIKELTNTAISVLYDVNKKFESGKITIDDAHKEAIERIRAMHYGRESKDYFWIQDTSPVMIMHPYREDLNSRDLSQIKDSRGVAIFVEFAKLVKKQKEGYIQYVWQWKDNPERLEPKESYICLFDPWGWIVGTGLYVHDVNEEIRKLKAKLIIISLAIFVIITLLLLYILRSSLTIERLRKLAEEHLNETTNRYKLLADAATEGILYIRNFKCRYGNPIALELSGYTSQELELIDIFDILPEISENAYIYTLINNLKVAQKTENNATGFIKSRNNTLIECTFKLQLSGMESSDGFLLLIRQFFPSHTENHVPSTGALGKLLKLPVSIAYDLREEIKKAPDSDAVIAICKNNSFLAESLLENGAHAPAITQMLSLVTDEVTTRLIDFYISDRGTPPVSFSFVAFGSQGRLEQTLLTDQDNAIIYLDDSSIENSQLQSYFTGMANFVCDGLIKCGYNQCRGKVMANNPQWCQPFTVWKEYFTKWINNTNAHEIMEFSIFFDLRVIYGNKDIENELHNYIYNTIEETPRFLSQIAQHALEFKSPLRLFGFIVPSSAKEHTYEIDLKAAMLPIVSFARVYSLQWKINPTNTLDRIDELARKGIILPSKKDDIKTAYNQLSRLRLQHQINLITQNCEKDNTINLSKIGHIEAAILRECFSEIDLLQAKIRKDFLDATEL
jgi:predicted metal-dependent phosphoesterase TrpH/PAS domain-containing protein